ncbi:large conductance mechanosensitive channel protein [Deinococcus phoenicis]|uniref:Large-conductance mechanosensitive channel n=1 Tax=Deinococcus phoenicis TaxID=1476583 RepID=A0A016QUM9_9DEIO|nr:large conductance mechanosensitive channel protein MscL [Deinococcus phoenicis]EYB69552.1 large conductance mechanosensitive channel protein [Deinococcus phoenicis]
MLKGFRNFVLRGNVVDLAVGVVIGAAFSGVVTAFTRAFLDPVVKLVTGGAVAGAIVLRRASPGVDAIVLDYGSFITALINFLLTALVLYLFVVTPANALMARLKREEKPAVAEPSNEEKLLAEIRDELRRRPGPPV